MFINRGMFWKAIAFILTCSAISLTHAQSNPATAQLGPALQILDTTKEQDGLIGSVRRVKTEYSRINIKEGRPMEGPRHLLELTTYGVKGNRVDNVSYPIADSTIGREEYKYDSRGNIIEKILRDERGAVLSREAYDYVFDKVGNWTKMTTSLVVVENGEFKREPTEVTYRSFTYYVTDVESTAATTAAESSKRPQPINQPTERMETTAESIDRSSMANSQKPSETRTVPVDATLNLQRTEEPGTQTKSSLKSAPVEPAVLVPAEIVGSPAGRPADTSTLSAPKKSTEVSDPKHTASRVEEATTKPEDATFVMTSGLPSESNKKTESAPERQPSASNTGLGNAVSSAASNASSSTKAFEIYELGRRQFDAGDVKAAIDSYLESLRLEPLSAEVQMNLGHAYLTTRKDKEAMKAFKEAVRLNPELAEGFYGLAFISFRSKNYKQAMDAFKKAIVLSPDMAKAHYGLALAYIELEKLDDMIHEYRILQRLDAKLAAKLAQNFPDIRRCEGTAYCR